MQNGSGNWLYISHGREVKRGEKRKGIETETPQDNHDRWGKVLKRLGDQ